MLQRGQALFETAVFLPLMLLAMVAIMYFSQYGVLQGRAVQAVRFASLVTNDEAASQTQNAQGQSALSMEAVYNELWQEGHSTNPSNPSPPLSSFSCANGGTQAAAAVYQKQTYTVPSPIPTATLQAFFQADTTPVGTCSPVPISLSYSGASSVASSYYVVQFTSVSAEKKVPGLLHAINVGDTNSQQKVSAGMGLTLPANPALVIYGSPYFAWVIDKSLTPQQPTGPTVMPSPYGDYSRSASASSPY